MQYQNSESEKKTLECNKPLTHDEPAYWICKDDHMPLIISETEVTTSEV